MIPKPYRLHDAAAQCRAVWGPLGVGTSDARTLDLLSVSGSVRDQESSAVGAGHVRARMLDAEIVEGSRCGQAHADSPLEVMRAIAGA